MPKRPAPVEEGKDRLDDDEEEKQSCLAGKGECEDKRQDNSGSSPSPSPSEEEEEEGEEEGGGGGGDDEDLGQIDVDFEFFNPGEEDFHGIKALLNNYVDDEAQWHCSDLVEAIIGSPAGSVIKCGADEDVIGVASLLRISDPSSNKGLQDAMDYSLRHCPDHLKTDLESAWKTEAAATGLLISERLINCPPQLAPPLMNSLMEEMKEASLSLKRLLFVTKAFLDPAVSTHSQKREGKKQKATRNEVKTKNEASKTNGPDLSELIFTTPEGEYLCAAASFAFAFASPSASREDDEFKPHRVVASILVEKIPEALDQMSEVVLQV